MHVMVDTGGQDEEGSMFWCMNVAGEDVAKALLKSMFDEVFFQTTVSLRSLTTCITLIQPASYVARCLRMEFREFFVTPKANRTTTVSDRTLVCVPGHRRLSQTRFAVI